MPEGEPQLPAAAKEENNEKVEQEIVEGTVVEADVLEEDDDFEDFQHEGRLKLVYMFLPLKIWFVFFSPIFYELI